MESKVLDEVKYILEVLSQGPASASDVVSTTRLPRYKVLSYIQLLEGLGFIRRLYSRGTYKIYSLTELGRRLLEAIREGISFRIEVVREEGSSIAVESEGSSESSVAVT